MLYYIDFPFKILSIPKLKQEGSGSLDFEGSESTQSVTLGPHQKASFLIKQTVL